MSQKRAAYNSAGAITAFYDDSISPAPQGVATIALTDAQWQACVADQRYTVVSGALVAPPVTPPPTDAQLLATAQAAQLSVLSAACAAQIVSGFPCDALGTTHTYPSKITDQQNLASSVLDAVMAKSAEPWAASTQYSAASICVSAGVPYLCVVGGETGAQEPTWPTVAGALQNDGTAQWEFWTTPFWCADMAGTWAWQVHTADQIQAVGRAVKTAILALQSKNAVLSAQVMACTTVAQVQAVTWS